MAESSTAAPVRIVIRLLLTIALVWLLPTLLPAYIKIDGGARSIIMIGITITLLNILVRPILHVITLPLKLFMTIFAIILVNGVFLWLAAKLIGMMDPEVASLTILGGAVGWIVVSLVLGIANWVMKEILK
jgi:putative membrane protein